MSIPSAASGKSPNPEPHTSPEPHSGTSSTPAPRGHASRSARSERPGAIADRSASPDSPPAPSTGLGGVLREDEFSVATAIGGPRGIAESAVPTLVFIVLFVISDSVIIPAVAAVAVVVVALVARIIQRQSPATVFGGLLGVALGAVLAIRSGDGTDFYAPGIVINAVSLLVLVVSILARRPLVGLLIGLLDPRVEDWGQHADARRVYTRATLLFAGLYTAKLGVQVPLLVMGHVAALGMAKLAMGLPAFTIVAYLVWLMHRGVIARRPNS